MRLAAHPNNLFSEKLSGLLILYVRKLKILRTVPITETA